MIVRGDIQTASLVYLGETEITAVMRGRHEVWSAIRDYWWNDEPWKNEEIW